MSAPTVGSDLPSARSRAPSGGQGQTRRSLLTLFTVKTLGHVSMACVSNSQLSPQREDGVGSIWKVGVSLCGALEGDAMTVHLATSSASHNVIPPVIIVALIGAIATTLVGLVNNLVQGRQAFKQIKLMQTAQITDRFMRAIDQLGNDSPQVRIGGVFALERIARESPLDRPHIVSSLTALIRDRSPASALVGESRDVAELMVRAPDAQAALTVLCRPPLSDDRSGSSGTGDLNLSRTDLRRAVLEENANLRGANLSNARLEGADLRWSDLRDSNFNKAHFGRYDPKHPAAQLGTDLRYANLTGAQLQGAIDFNLAQTEGTIGLTTSSTDRTA